MELRFTVVSCTSPAITISSTLRYGTLAVFRRILPFTQKRNLRIILLNRRDYPGSSPYSDEDLKKCSPTSDAETAESFYRTVGEEYVTFMAWLVDHANIPPISSDGKKGGIALMAWSAGNAYTIPVLAFADKYPEKLREKLDPYFRKLVLFGAPSAFPFKTFHERLTLVNLLDASRWTVGPGPFIDGDDPLRDTSMTPEQRREFFNTWVAGYYTHKSMTSRNIADLVKRTYDPSPPPTTKVMSPSELSSLTDFAAVTHSEVVVRTVDSSILADHCRWAMFDDKKAKYWPKVSVDVTWCEKSAWVMIDAAWWVQTLQDEAREKGINGRKVTFTMFPEANHFVRSSYYRRKVEKPKSKMCPLAALGRTRESRELFRRHCGRLAVNLDLILLTQTRNLMILSLNEYLCVRIRNVGVTYVRLL
jgi:hypothetical protein